VWWYTPAFPALRRLKQEDCKFKVSLGYIVRLSQKTKTNKQQTKKVYQREQITEKISF
jgi:hypothetical protein